MAKPLFLVFSLADRYWEAVVHPDACASQDSVKKQRPPVRAIHGRYWSKHEHMLFLQFLERYSYIRLGIAPPLRVVIVSCKSSSQFKDASVIREALCTEAPAGHPPNYAASATAMSCHK
jgi:hypothetical protein